MIRCKICFDEFTKAWKIFENRDWEKAKCYNLYNHVFSEINVYFSICTSITNILMNINHNSIILIVSYMKYYREKPPVTLFCCIIYIKVIMNNSKQEISTFVKHFSDIHTVVWTIFPLMDLPWIHIFRRTLPIWRVY